KQPDSLKIRLFFSCRIMALLRSCLKSGGRVMTGLPKQEKAKKFVTKILKRLDPRQPMPESARPGPVLPTLLFGIGKRSSTKAALIPPALPIGRRDWGLSRAQ